MFPLEIPKVQNLTKSLSSLNPKRHKNIKITSRADD